MSRDHGRVSALSDLPPPARSFASDTTAPALPEVLEALAEANVGHVPSYGDDPWTREVITRFRDAVNDGNAAVRLCFSGTGANMLAAGLSGYRRLIVAEQSHIAQDEESCVVFGMPAEAIRQGGADEITPLGGIAASLTAACARRPRLVASAG